MAHVTLIDQPKGVVARLAPRYSRRRFGQAVEPVMAASSPCRRPHGHGDAGDGGRQGLEAAGSPVALAGHPGHGGRDRLLVVHRLRLLRGDAAGIDPQKVRDVPRFRHSDVYDDTERVVLEYAVAATASPVALSDELIERLHRHLSEPEIVELAAWVALENLRSRFNAGLGLKSQGFSDRCEVAPR
jgi:hypothetical protein